MTGSRDGKPFVVDLLFEDGKVRVADMPLWFFKNWDESFVRNYCRRERWHVEG